MDWMSLRRCRIAGMPSLVLAVLVAPLATLQAQPPPGEIRVARLIRDLGSRDYSQRQAADAQLATLGNQSRAQLEKALTDEDVEVRLRARHLLDRLKVDELWSAGSITLAAKGEPASKLLATLATQTGNHIYVGDPYGHFADKPLDRDYQGSSYWQAVDDICSATGNRIRPHYDMNTPGIVVSSGAPGNYPRAYAGPVRAQITSARRVFIEEMNYEEHKAELTHSFQINLQFTWEDRFRVVGYATQPELVRAVTDGQTLVGATQPAGGGWSATTRGLRQVAATVKLNPVPISARALEVFKIRWGLIVVGEPACLKISPVECERLYAQDDVAVRIEAIEKQPNAKYLLTLNVVRDLAMPEPQEVIFQEYEVDMVDEQGRGFRLQSQNHALSDRGVQLKIAFLGHASDSQPKLLRVHYPRLRARRDLELTFRDVPLPVSRPE